MTTKNMTKSISCLICHKRTRVIYSELVDDRYSAPGRFDIYYCESCDFGQTFPRLAHQQLSKFYSRYYPLSQATVAQVRENAQRMRPFFCWFQGFDHQTHLYVPKGSTVLDIGSGTGAAVLYLQNNSCQAFGVEPDTHAQKLARRLKLNIFHGLLSDQPFPHKSFSHITASQVLEHEPQPDKFLSIANQRLVSQGKLILSVPNLNSFNRQVFGRHWVNWHVPYHLNFFTLKSITKLARKHRLRLYQQRTVTPLIWVRLQLQLRFNPQNKPGIVASSILLVSLLTVPLYRLLDTLGLGDSLVVTFVKSGKK